MNCTLAQFIFESNTFAPEEAEIDLFKQSGVWLDAESDIRHWASETDSQMHGSLQILELEGVKTNPCFVAMCGSSAG